MYFLKLGGILRSELKPFHKRLGFVSIMSGLATIGMGVQEKQTKGSLEGTPLHFTFAIEIFVYATMACLIFSVTKFVDKSDNVIQRQIIKDDGMGNRRDFTRIRDSSNPQNDNKHTIGAAASGGQYNSLKSDGNKNSFNPYGN